MGLKSRDLYQYENLLSELQQLLDNNPQHQSPDHKQSLVLQPILEAVVASLLLLLLEHKTIVVDILVLLLVYVTMTEGRDLSCPLISKMESRVVTVVGFHRLSGKIQCIFFFEFKFIWIFTKMIFLSEIQS